MSKIEDIKKQAAMVQKRYGSTLGASKGSKPAPKAKISLKGTNPLKGKAAITISKKY